MITSTTRRSASTRNFKRRASGGFTLVELLVVIGIIAVLISVLLPALSRARQSGNQVKCMANMRSLGTALQMYASEQKGFLPYGFIRKGAPIRPAPPPPAPSTYDGEDGDWTTSIVYIIGKKQGIGYSQDTVTSGDPRTRAVFLCPEVFRESSTKAFLTHYSSHPRILPDFEQQDWLGGNPMRSLKPYKLSKIKRASELGLLFDGTVNNGDYGAWSVAYAIDRKGKDRAPYLTDDYSLASNVDGSQPVDLMADTGVGGTAADTNTDSTKNPGNVRFRHMNNTQANVLMADGHVQSFTFNKSNKTSDLLRKNIYVNR
jgi:prepilin-type processing-associated H-X9-DG protein/prepilin-type N-terminal cleavage/methylation domain-containing protein